MRSLGFSSSTFDQQRTIVTIATGNKIFQVAT